MSVPSDSERAWPAGRRAVLTFTLVLEVVLIGWVDYRTGAEIDISILYMIPIAMGAWCVGRRTGYGLAALSSITWFLADLYCGFHYSHPTIPYWNAAVGLAFFLIIAGMLSTRKQAEQRILELMNIKSEFTSMVSHELRTPLTCIKEGIDIVADGSSGPLNARQQEHLETAKRNVDRLARLLNDVLTYQKLEAHRMELFLRPYDVNRLVEQVAQGFALPAEKKGLEIMLDLAPVPLSVSCDADKVSQVLSNLLSNALKFSDRGRILIRTALVSEGVRVAIQDQGPGIASEELTKLFQGFTQLSNTRGKKMEGTGLGLAIAREIIELHGSRLEVASRPGHGSTFFFTLPLTGSARAARTEAAPYVLSH
jgi:signal transduction histidine kinase